jgi:ATP-dependent DNA helicase RecG
MDLHEAILQAHYPADDLSSKQSRQRLAFDELLLLQLGVLDRKREWQQDQPGYKFTIDMKAVNAFTASLSFKLTSAQDRVVREILDDLKRDVPMSRLLQGDVGSGKTVVATIALLVAVQNGFQGALMAPTEILAEQHYSTMYKLLSAVSSDIEKQGNITSFTGPAGSQFKIALLTGSLSSRDKRAVHEVVACGDVSIVIGTHALIQKEVAFNNLGLIVIDEQHRFGVLQRSALRQKGFNPHLLVMTATPIPRTLALTLYGDLDISTISEMPPGRLAIKTRWLPQHEHESAYRFMRKEIASGRQAFIICPLIEESESLDVKAAIAEYERLSGEVFPDLKLGLLHGKMKGADKDGVMQDFKNGKIDILVSTSVVEVGIDVPNATVMLVEAADRFGLAQLHQFRGRVGRGAHQSYCLLLAEARTEHGQERLKAIEQTTDGFLLAEKDLELRGPGEFFGTRQSGLPELKMARLTDTQLLEMARREAMIIFEKDPQLRKPEHRDLAVELSRRWQRTHENN